MALGRKPDEAIPAGIVDLRGDKNAACVEAGGRVFLFHRALRWGDPPCIWCGDFSRGFEEAVRNATDGAGRGGAPAAITRQGPGERSTTLLQVPEALPRLSPPVENRIFLAPLPAWSAYKIGLGAQPLAVGSRRLFTYHVRSDPYQYWWSAGLLREEEGRPALERLLPFPVCFPDTPSETIGDVPKVSFLCGATLNGDTLEFWCGGADTTVVKVELGLDVLLDAIERHGIGVDELGEATRAHVRRNRAALDADELVDKRWLEPLLSS